MRRLARPSFLFGGLIAILLQVFAPGWAAVAMARQAVTVDGIAICSVDHAPRDDSAPAKTKHLVCPICHIAAVGQHALLPEQSIPIPSSLSVPLRHPHAEIAAPRGPPALTSRARGPPSLS
ncbi:DUF2946 family protein [Rhodopila sp.]|uniref:DUF2946 family protein n=1 Tax=Rhodopila sp. TaxID=2480087 RepID=UPI002CC052BD|nr:DUF2946 family protein [Rhodopila sp.]HVZ07223.1 DUF2946 family protein [Rhodopila sp.]